MTEFWEKNFIEKHEMWGFEPSHSTLLAKALFAEKGVKNVLVPGIGYGRNAQVFIENGMTVTGIEISETAIEMARKHYGKEMIIHHGAVNEMPFDANLYDGIFCYALIHLLDEKERKKLINDCYNQLVEGGYMIFTAVTKEAPNYGKGKFISEDRFEFYKGAKIFYFDKISVQAEFEGVGLLEIIKINESQPMYFIKCRRK